MSTAAWDPHACRAVDALRSGVVTRYIAQRLTYGRDAEIRALEKTITRSPDGSCQVVIGEYGVGKSHLSEVLELRFEAADFAVARLELGASHGRAENPSGVLRAIGSAIRVRVHGRTFCGDSEVTRLLKAAVPPTATWRWDYHFVLSAHRRFPRSDQLLARYDAIATAYAAHASDAESWYTEPTSFTAIPSSMTAANLAVASVNKLAHALRPFGVKGVVLLFDEAERSNWAWTYYQTDRARDLIRGFALAAANRDTSHLKHYRNAKSSPYRPLAPSLMHSIFWFTDVVGLAAWLSQEVDIQPMHLAPLDLETLHAIQWEVGRLYCEAYKQKVSLDPGHQERVWDTGDGVDTRHMVRRFVAALDATRLKL